ncbi:hypothetical protein J6590_047512 [Homalodisca vitripennis]|nr:hypothetical protein J6590_047512 [Homalodisca vitripennis]
MPQKFRRSDGLKLTLSPSGGTVWFYSESMTSLHLITGDKSLTSAQSSGLLWVVENKLGSGTVQDVFKEKDSRAMFYRFEPRLICHR